MAWLLLITTVAALCRADQIKGTVTVKGTFRAAQVSVTPVILGWQARTDQCVTGTEAGCGTGQGQGTALLFRDPASDMGYLPDVGGYTQIDPLGTQFIDPDFGGTGWRCTDGTWYAGSQVDTIDNGNGIKNNTNFTMVFATTGTTTRLISFDSYRYLSDGSTLNPDFGHCRKTRINGAAAIPTQYQMWQGTHANWSSDDPTIFYHQVGPGFYKQRVKFASLSTGAACVQTADNFADCQPDHLERFDPDGTLRTASPYKYFIDFVDPNFIDSTGKMSTHRCLDPSYQVNWSASGHFSKSNQTFSMAYGGGVNYQNNHYYNVDDQVFPRGAGQPSAPWVYYVYHAGTSLSSGHPTWGASQGQHFCDDGSAPPCSGLEWVTMAKAMQDGGTEFVVWRLGKGCIVGNTRLMKILRADFGPTGYMTDGSTCVADGVTSCGNSLQGVFGGYQHESAQDPPEEEFGISFGQVFGSGAPNGKAACPYTGGGNWEIGTLNFRFQNSQVNGHGGQGLKAFYMPRNFYKQDWGNPYAPACGNPPPKALWPGTATSAGSLYKFMKTIDQHATYLNADGNDSTPFCYASYPTDENGLDALANPYENMVVCQRTDWPVGQGCFGSGTGCPMRMFHLFHSMYIPNDQLGNFQAHYSFCQIGQGSNQGNVFMTCNSDWMRTLGCTDRTASPCSDPHRGRDDLFIFWLNSAH